MPISQDQITTLDQLEEKLTLALTDLLLLRDSNNEDYKVKVSTILQAAVDKAGAELIGGNVESGNTKAVTGNEVANIMSALPNDAVLHYSFDEIPDIPDGTPIIDNVNGENNGTNNGGVAAQGVSGKGVYFPSATQNALIPSTKLPAPNSNSSITISLWIKFDTDYPMEEAATTGIVRIGQFQGLFGLCKSGGNIVFYARDSSVTRYASSPIETGVWHNIVVVYNGTTHSAILYDNGSSKGSSEPNIANFQFGSNETNWNIWGNTVVSGSGDVSINKKATIDDLLIYDRALTDSEVMALYLNKANTPKYYNRADWKLEQIEAAAEE